MNEVYFDLGNDIFYIGFNDYHSSYIETSNPLRNGCSFNSFIIIDEKPIIIESMDDYHFKEWLEKIEETLKGKKLNYLLIQHVEPSNSESIKELIKKYPDIEIVSSEKSFIMMKEFLGLEFNKKIIIKEGDILKLGKHSLSFIDFPTFDWPEIILTFDIENKILFSNKFFSMFGSNSVYETWDYEPRRFYSNILARSGTQINNLLKKMTEMDVKQIYPVHGRIITENLGHQYYLYGLWSNHKAEENGITIIYTSVYGQTKIAAEILSHELESLGDKVILHDLSKIHWSYPLSDTLKNSKLVLATTTFYDNIYPIMNLFIEQLISHDFQNRVVAFMENGSWNPVANKIMKSMIEKCKDITFLNNSVTIMATVNENVVNEIKKLASELHQAQPVNQK